MAYICTFIYVTCSFILLYPEAVVCNRQKEACTTPLSAYIHDQPH